VKTAYSRRGIKRRSLREGIHAQNNSRDAMKIILVGDGNLLITEIEVAETRRIRGV
jgi:hypothetical protein